MKSNISNESDVDAAILQTAQDFEDSSLEELKKFTSVSRITSTLNNVSLLLI